jgi:N-acetylneuraminic acid mutarotase
MSLQAPAWRQIVPCGGTGKDTVPGARSGAASVVVGTKMYMFGGYGGNGRLGDFFVYDFEERRWSRVDCKGDVMPGVRENNGMVVHGDCLYLFGGYNGSTWLNDFHRFDLEQSRWSVVDVANDSADPPAPRFGYVSSVWSDTFIVFGGYDGTTWLNDTHAFSFVDRRWSLVQAKGAAPSIRSCPSWTQRAKSIYIFGGYDGVQRMNDFYEFNVETFTWTEILSTGDVPSQRYFHASVVYDDTMYTFGGYNGSSRLNDMHRFDFGTSRWTRIDPGVAADRRRAGRADGASASAASTRPAQNDAGGRGRRGSGSSADGARPQTARQEDGDAEAGGAALRSGFEASVPAAGPVDRRAEGGSAGSARVGSRGHPSGRSSIVAQVYGNSMVVFGGYDGRIVLNDFYEFRFAPVLVPPPTLVQDLRQLVDNPDLSDVVFVVEGRDVHASRVHLAARSEHFKAMLFGGMREGAGRPGKGRPHPGPGKGRPSAGPGNGDGGAGDPGPDRDEASGLPRVVVEDVRHDVFLKLMEFLMTDAVQTIPHDLAVPLLIASERFLLARLKALCEDSIRKRIAVDNVVETFIAADHHRAAGLKELCLEFIVENMDAVKRTPTFSPQMTREPELLMEVVMRTSSR